MQPSIETKLHVAGVSFRRGGYRSRAASCASASLAEYVRCHAACARSGRCLPSSFARAADDVILCVSELAANAVLHSNSRRPGGTFTVRIESCPGAYIRIEVEDDGGPWIARAPTRQAAAGLTSSARSRPNGESPPAPQAVPSGPVSIGPAPARGLASSARTREDDFCLPAGNGAAPCQLPKPYAA
jgi:hypothetical protein